MKSFAKKNITQKILIVIIMVFTLNFTIPKPVQADTVGTIFSPFMGLIGIIADGIEHLLEWAVLGESDTFMKSISEGTALSPTVSGAPTITVDGSKIDGTFWGKDEVNIPIIKYSPEEIFSGKVPALDINFLSPEHPSDDRSPAAKLQDTIASWYKALRTIAIVGLLTVIVYLGIRMLITSLAADKAKYKKMIMDWVVAMCLLFVMHYIMAFVLTATQTLIGILGGQTTGSLNISVTGSSSYSFSTNLIGYTRFMMQHVDLNEKVAFTVLYIMQLIFSVRFTWTYLKRVVNMAFLTVIAPFVTLTYPIDKVSDGKAQAFNIWLREYLFNCLMQPLHLLLYMLLLGSAMELASENVLYAMVCFGFIIAAEKLVKKMFGFDKASGGTVGSLAGAAGVSLAANKALHALAPKPGGKGGQNKIRTQGGYERTGRDTDSNNVFKGFEDNAQQGTASAEASAAALGAGAAAESREQQNENSEEERRQQEQNLTAEEEERRRLEQQNGQQEQERQQNGSQEQQQQGQGENSEEQRGQGQPQENGQPEQTPPTGNPDANPNTDGSPNRNMTQKQLERARRIAEGTPTATDLIGTGARRGAAHVIRGARGVAHASRHPLRTLRTAGAAAGGAIAGAAIGAGKAGWGAVKAAPGKLNQAAGNAMVGAGKAAKAAGRAVKEAAPVAAYKLVRGGVKAAAMTAGALAVGTVAASIAATTGDAEKGLGVLTGGIAAGAGLGGKLFENTVGQVAPDRSIKGAIDTGIYGSKRAAQNAKADKAYLRSEEFDEYYNDQIKTSKDLKHMSKEDVRKAVLDYRQCGITDNKQIKNALKLEQTTGANGKKFTRAEAQNVVQSMSFINQKAYRTKETREAEIKRIEGMLSTNLTPQQKQTTAQRIFEGNQLFMNM